MYKKFNNSKLNNKIYYKKIMKNQQLQKIAYKMKQQKFKINQES